MTRKEFEASLRAVLDAQLSHAIRQVQLTLGSIPATARELIIEILPAQDGDGQFDVRATLSGPDLYVLNRAIHGSALIFGVRHTATGFDPPVPMVDPDDVDFDGNDAIVDVTAEWLRAVWREVGASTDGIPVLVAGHDDHGTTTPLRLRG